jgi:hypothetical protein
MNPSDAESMKTMMEQISAGALGFVLLAWAAGAFVGGWVAAKIAQRSQATFALIVGALLLAGGIYNLVTIPHPLWFSIIGVLLFGGLRRGKAGRRRETTPSPGLKRRCDDNRKFAVITLSQTPGRGSGGLREALSRFSE